MMRCPVYFHDHIWHIHTANFVHFSIWYQNTWHPYNILCKSTLCRSLLGMCDFVLPDPPVRASISSPSSFTPGVQLSLFEVI